MRAFTVFGWLGLLCGSRSLRGRNAAFGVARSLAAQRCDAAAGPRPCCGRGSERWLCQARRRTGATGTGSWRGLGSALTWLLRQPAWAAWFHSISPCRSFRKVLSVLLIDDV